MEDLTGKQLNAYQVIEPLGEGGMAAVYKAFQPGMDRYVALKILPRHFAKDPEFIGRFKQEAKVLASLQHPHILPVFDYGEADGYTYIVMPLLQSGELTDLLQSSQPLSLPQIRRIITQIGDALDYAHQHGLIHRDVKPSNVLLDERQNCLLTDFGIAKITQSSAKLTATGGIVGTPAYMSPEQGMGKTLDGRSDIYALGIMLYEMITGRVPYRAETPMAVVFKHINDPLPPPREVSPALPQAVERVVLKALAKEPDDRFATAGQMVKALQAAIPEAEPQPSLIRDEEATIISAARPTLQAKSRQATEPLTGRKPARLNPIWILAAVAVMLATIGAIAFFVMGGAGREENVPEVTEAAAIIITEEPAFAPTSEGANDSQLTLYDDFDDSAFDGTWDSALWTEAPDFGHMEIEQRNGILTAARYEPGSSGLTAVEFAELNWDDLGFIEAKIKLDSNLEASRGDVGIVLLEAYEEKWWFGCNIGAVAGNSEAWAGCDSSDDYSDGVTISFDTWHTVRFEIDPRPAEIAFFIDGKPIATYLPPDTNTLKKEIFKIDLRVYSNDGGLITGYFDDIRVGSLDQ